MVMLHSGGFRGAHREKLAHQRLAEDCLELGYALAVPDYRVKTDNPAINEISVKLEPILKKEFKKQNLEAQNTFTGALPLAALEDAHRFLNWYKDNYDKLGLEEQVLLAGSSAGAITVMNVLYLSSEYNFDLKQIQSCFAASGAFYYDPKRAISSIPVLVYHGPNDDKIRWDSACSLSEKKGSGITLKTHTRYVHGRPKLSRIETVKDGLTRIFEFHENAPKKRLTKEPRICVISTAKNEGPYILEWVAHNIIMGADDFIVYSNDCVDGTDKILDRLDELGIIRHVPNPEMMEPTNNYHRKALAYAPYWREFKSADYIFVTDIDEFTQVNSGDGTYRALLEEMNYPDAISLSEYSFGFGGQTQYQDHLITEKFQYVSSNLHQTKKRLRTGVKSISRNCSIFKEQSNHRPQMAEEYNIYPDWRDGSGNLMPASFIWGGDRGIDIRHRTDIARVNHYAVRSGDAMLVKLVRGSAVGGQHLSQKYFQKRGPADQEDKGMNKYLPMIKAKLKELKSDQKLRSLHEESVKQYQAHIQTLKNDSYYADFYKKIEDVAKITTE